MTIFLILALTVTSVTLAVVGLGAVIPTRSREVSKRLGEIKSVASRHTASERRGRQRRREQLEVWLQSFGERMANRRTDWIQVRQRLARAGFRSQNAVAVFFGIRTLNFIVAGGMVLVLVPFLRLQVSQLFMWVAAGGIVGWILPSAFISRRIRMRQKELVRALPDTLDMLVVCVEAGLGLNQAVVRTSEEVEHISEAMAEELAIVNFEIRAGTPREDALRNLGERTGVPDIRSLTTMLIQTDRFGTSIAQALRVHSDTLRVKRRQRAEETAAKTTIKLVIPLVLFIFPSMFVVILGPAVISIIDSLSSIS